MENPFRMLEVVKRWYDIPTWMKVFAFNALPIAYVIAELYDGYIGWLALGPGGLPYNFKGYLTNLLLTAVYAKRDTTSLEPYGKPEKHAVGWQEATADEKENAQKSFFGKSLSTRAGPQSKAKSYCAPQREHNANRPVDPEVKKTYLEGLDKLMDKYSDALEWSTSLLEMHGQAVFLRSSFAVPTLISKCQREVAHIHESDLSAHVLLSFDDAKSTIEQGWGERHRLTGTAMLPLGYTLLYAPRDREEVEVFLRIFEAGIEYAKSSGKN